VAANNATDERLHAAQLEKHAALAGGPIPLSRAGAALFHQAFLTLFRGSPRGVQEAVATLRRLSAKVSPEERSRIRDRLRAVARLFAEAISLAKARGLDMTDAVRIPAAFDEDPAAWPGHHLSARVARTRRRDMRRKPRRSDWTDIDHAMHFPYVDVATCDANAGDIAIRALREMRCPRTPALVRTKHLDEVVVAVRALGPMAD
jgi:hypothetical protein